MLEAVAVAEGRPVSALKSTPSPGTSPTSFVGACWKQRKRATPGIGNRGCRCVFFRAYFGAAPTSGGTGAAHSAALTSRQTPPSMAKHCPGTVPGGNLDMCVCRRETKASFFCKCYHLDSKLSFKLCFVFFCFFFGVYLNLGEHEKGVVLVEHSIKLVSRMKGCRFVWDMPKFSLGKRTKPPYIVFWHNRLYWKLEFIYRRPLKFVFEYPWLINPTHGTTLTSLCLAWGCIWLHSFLPVLVNLWKCNIKGAIWAKPHSF